MWARAPCLHQPCLHKLWQQSALDTRLTSAILCLHLSADGQLTDLASFYTLPSSIIGNERHSELKAAFQYYTVANSVPLPQLM